MDNNIRAAKAYLVIEKDRNGWPSIAAIRKEAPALRAGQVAIRLVVNVPLSLFYTFIPDVTVELHEGDIIEPTVEVEPAPTVDDDEEEPV